MLPIKDINPTRRAPVITRALLALNVLAFVPVFYVAYVLGDADLYAELMMTWGLVPSRLLLGQSLYALLTSMFMHAHILHLVGNMIYLRVFGDNVEDVLGRLGYLFFYLLCGLTATFTHVLICILTASGLNVPVVGASGAISGILGAYVVFFPGARILTYTAYRAIYVKAKYYIGFWFFYQLLCGLLVFWSGLHVEVAYWAHIGGFLMGVFVGLLFRDRARQMRAPVPAFKPWEVVW